MIRFSAPSATQSGNHRVKIPGIMGASGCRDETEGTNRPTKSARAARAHTSVPQLWSPILTNWQHIAGMMMLGMGGFLCSASGFWLRVRQARLERSWIIFP
jgi:hypothetical protein